jgi:hypothetical protein
VNNFFSDVQGLIQGYEIGSAGIGLALSVASVAVPGIAIGGATGAFSVMGASAMFHYWTQQTQQDVNQAMFGST